MFLQYFGVLTRTKEEMQAMFFLRYDYVKKALILLLSAIILELIVHSPEVEHICGPSCWRCGNSLACFDSMVLFRIQSHN